jgi:hypothetical protein
MSKTNDSAEKVLPARVDNPKNKAIIDSNSEPFLTDVKQLRIQARQNIEKGALTPAYQGDVKQTIDILQGVLATEIVCTLRYTMNAVVATGLSSQSVKEEFDEHAKEEQGHMRLVAERINQLGGRPSERSRPLRFAPEKHLVFLPIRDRDGRNIFRIHPIGFSNLVGDSDGHRAGLFR